MLNLRESWQFWALTAGVFAALTAILIKLGIEEINSDVATFIRTLIILPLLAAFLYFSGQFKNPGPLSSRTITFLALSAGATALSWLAYFRALKIGAVSQVAPLEKISILLVALFGILFLRENFSTLNWLGLIFILLGTLLIGR